MAFPVATTEEIWKLGETLPVARLLLFAAGSIFFLSLIIYQLHHAEQSPQRRRDFLLRVFCTYGLTVAISALMLLGVDRLELLVHPWVGIKRTILVVFPASFAATVVDSLR
jgi:uncharacterized membrane protein